MNLTQTQLAAGWDNRGELPVQIPNSRALIEKREGRFVTVLQARIGGSWTTIVILSSTASLVRAKAERLGREAACEFGVPWEAA